MRRRDLITRRLWGRSRERRPGRGGRWRIKYKRENQVRGGLKGNGGEEGL
jgi:hypothetical protein